MTVKGRGEQPPNAPEINVYHYGDYKGVGDMVLRLVCLDPAPDNDRPFAYLTDQKGGVGYNYINKNDGGRTMFILLSSALDGASEVLDELLGEFNLAANPLIDPQKVAQLLSPPHPGRID